MQKFILALLVIVGLVQCRQKAPSPQKNLPVKKSSIIPINATYDDFGIDISDFKIKDYSIKRNESLYVLLQQFNLTQRQIYRAIEKAKKVIDVRSLKPKQPYRAYVSEKGDKLQKIVWEPNPIDFVTFDWQQDSLQIYRASRAVSKKVSHLTGTIHSSLYNAISDKAGRDVLVDKLSDILAWKVNFFNLRKGDTFNVVYEKKYVDGQYFDIGKILAVKLSNMGDTYHAYLFKDGNIDGYYDKKGRSVKSALLKTPFKYDERISSRFNMHRFHPILHRVMPHTGVDFAAPYGTPVLAVGSGTVLEAHYGGAAGNIIKIRHNRTFKTAYMHLSKFAHGIHHGAHVKQGEVIGYVGNTGRVTGTHLHYSLYKNNKPINPLKVKLPASKSLPEKYMAHFKKVRDGLSKKLSEKNEKEADSASMGVAAVQ